MTADPIPGWTGRFVRFGLIALLVGCGSTNPTAPPSPSASAIAVTASPVATASPTASPNPTAAATTEPTPASPSPSTTANGWSPVPDQASVANTQFTDVVWNGTRFVAIGTDSAGDGAFLESTDGLTWTQQTTAPNGRLDDLAAGPNGIVAIGILNDRPGSWFSADGVTWKFGSGRFQLPTLGTDTVNVTSVVATDDGWVAVGRRDAACNIDCGLDPLRAMVWTSHDGLTWTRVADQASFAKAAMMSVTRLGRTIVAVGYAVRRAVVWTSTNGTTWTRVPDAPMFHPRSSNKGWWIQMTGVTAGNGVIVAIGMDADGLCQDVCGRSVRAWWSTDGKAWTKGTSADFIDGQSDNVNAMPTGFLATGASGSDKCPGGIWASHGGRSWSCAATDPGFQGFSAISAAGSPSVELVVGFGNAQALTGGAPGAIWWRPVP